MRMHKIWEYMHIQKIKQGRYNNIDVFRKPTSINNTISGTTHRPAHSPYGTVQPTTQLLPHLHSSTFSSSHSQPFKQNQQQHFQQSPYHTESLSSDRQQQSSQIRCQTFCDQEVQRMQRSMKALEERVQKMERLSENARKVEEQTLSTCHNLRNQIVSSLNANDQGFLQRVKHLTQIQQKWIQKSQQRTQQVEVKLEKRAQELKKQMSEKMQKILKQERAQTDIDKQIEERIKKILKQERAEAEKINQHKFDEIAKELQKQKIETREQMKTQEEKLKEEIKTIVEEEKKGRKYLEDRMILRIMEESEAIEVTNNKIAELIEKKQMQNAEKIEEVEIMMKKKENESEKLVDWKTPYAHFFHIQANNITHQKQYYTTQIMLDVVIERMRKFAFSMHITHTKEGNIKIGVVDRYAQGQMENSYSSGNAVCYCGVDSKYYIIQKITSIRYDYRTFF